MQEKKFIPYSEYRSGAFDTLLALRNYLDRNLLYNTDKYMTKNNLKKVLDCLLGNLDYFLEYQDLVELGFVFDEKKKTQINKCSIIRS